MRFTKHAREQMAFRNISEKEVLSVLKAAKEENIQRSWKNDRVFLVKDRHSALRVVVASNADIISTYREGEEDPVDFRL